ncbi:hypothetical protein GPLA_4621 [Paraglaciecola polaris LMG 21857]|uniref:Uncharacterized protein n=1 Tax=Paraglaciecola polaris LMG 21857 TaxID=1129793 RepID=K7AJN2_9ALTE|nr:hypothetical protein GPLA_4621 [Paraglaciecola polaris LMG 21857]
MRSFKHLNSQRSIAFDGICSHGVKCLLRMLILDRPQRNGLAISIKQV